ncbi:MAG: hypothetical protein JXR83_10455 [Deltaproteobacteria bacterium]|nr:hypothetical protein [Deltaproteobacteria bacterium]
MRLLHLVPVLAIGWPLFAQATESEAASAPGERGATLVLSPHCERAIRPAVESFTRGLARAAERDGGTAALLDADLIAVTPGDLVARCPARISTRCLGEAAGRVGAARTLSGAVQKVGEGFLVQLKVVDGESGEVVALRSVRLFPAWRDSVDMEAAGECIGLDALWSAAGVSGALEQPLCRDRVFATSWRDRQRYAPAIAAEPVDWWLTVLPDAAGRRAYTAKNSLLAGGLATAIAVGVVGAAAGVLLAVQSLRSNGDVAELARTNPQAFASVDGKVTVVDELDPAVARYRELDGRRRLEVLAAGGSGLLALVAGVVAFGLYQHADVPGRYDDYTSLEDEEATAPAAGPQQL